jgi:release factor glutamine methyltransferase
MTMPCVGSSTSILYHLQMADFHPLRSSKDDGSSSWKALDRAAEKRAREAPSAEMPSLDHASMKDFHQVYEPSDDTYLLIDGIQDDWKQNRSTYESNFKIILEIGCGSGVPIVNLAKLLPGAKPMATDINPAALEFARRTAIENGVNNLEAIQCDLGTDLLPKFCHQIDAIIFNPPYVPTPDDEVAGNGIEASWAGGERGRRVVDRAIPQIAELLSVPHGVCYMITVDDNEPEEMAKQFDCLGMLMTPLVRRRARNEYLSVQKITPKAS